MTKWISVEDRMPKLCYLDVISMKSDDVLVFDPMMGILRAVLYESIGWEEEALGYNDGCPKINPTHWMPLPEIPTEDKS